MSGVTDYRAGAQEALLAESGLSVEGIRRHLARATGLDWADAYIQKRVLESWQLEDGIVKGGSYSSDGGIGLRAVQDETTAYASSDAIDVSALNFWGDVARVAKTQSGGAKTTTLPTAAVRPPLYTDRAPASETADKIALMKKIDATLRAEDDIENVTVSLVAAHEVVMVVHPDGVLGADYRPMVRLNVQAVVVQNGRREAGHAAIGGRCQFDLFGETQVRDLCAKALGDARAKLTAQPAPAGKMPVVLGNGWAGVLLHEAVGHGLEADFNRKRLSAFSGRVGERVAADCVTVVDAGNIADRRGSLNCDDEGVPTQETVLIENGVLKGYLQDVTNARLMGAAVTGNGRRESYAHAPMPRMTNTFMPAGDYAPEEIISTVEHGIYAQDFNGGEVDITNGNFVFVVSKARLIEKGQLGAVVKGATIIGNGPAIMPLVSMVGNDFALDPGVGTCGKDGQWVPVGVGQPTLKIDSITVGGTQV